jgi:hypothetical protein
MDSQRRLHHLVKTKTGTHSALYLQLTQARGRRIALTLRRNLYTYRKETRRPGEDFNFRHACTFTRTEPSSTP